MPALIDLLDQYLFSDAPAFKLAALRHAWGAFCFRNVG